MKQKGNWSFFELYALPIKLRNWFFEKLVNYFKEASEGQK